MIAVQLNEDGYVSGFDMVTLTRFETNEKYRDPSWRFVDRTDFWEPSDIKTFMVRPSIFLYDDVNKYLTCDYTLI